MGQDISRLCGSTQPQQDYELAPANNRAQHVAPQPRTFTTASEHPHFADMPRSASQSTRANIGNNRSFGTINMQGSSGSNRGMQPLRTFSQPNVERPDLSNISSVHPDVKLPRTKQALRSFNPTTYDFKKAVSDAGLSHMLGEGSCFGVSLEWATARMQNHDANLIGEKGGLFKQPVLQRAIRTQQEYEATYSDAKTSGKHFDSEAAGRAALEGTLSAKGVSFSRWDGGIDGEEIGRKISAPGAHIINLTGFNDGHAIAAFTPPPHSKDPRSIVFDPNAGEFRMHPSEVDYFFTALQARYECSGQRYGGAEVLSIHR